MGGWENRGRKGYERRGYWKRERKGREVGVLKRREAGEIVGNYATMLIILQSKKALSKEAKKTGAGPGMQGAVGRRFGTF